MTGAGGTIGEELARQVWACHPRSLILIERSEPALFEIEQELKEDGAGSEMTAVVADTIVACTCVNRDVYRVIVNLIVFACAVDYGI